MALSLRDIGFRLGYDIDKQSEAEVESSIKSLKSMATKLLGAIGIGFSLTQVNALAEEFNSINDKINYAIKGLADEKEAQEAILKAANDTKSSYSDMADIVSDLVKSNSDLFPIDDAVSFSSTVTKLLKTAGRSDNEIQSMMDALNKSFQKGSVETETLNTMLEQCPEAANLLADSLGVAKTQLLDMASNGEISVEQLKNAFLNASDEIDKEFSNLNYSISDAILNMRNSWGYFIDDFNSTFKVTQTLAKAITRLSDIVLTAAQKIKTRLEWIGQKLGGAEKLTKLVTIAAAALCAVVVAQNAGKIISLLNNVTKKLSGINKKTLAIVAVIVILALIVEDFIAFMKGENSLFGTLLEKAGVDVDKFRENVIKVWENIKKILPAIWRGIKNVGIPIFQALWKAIKTVFQAIGKIISWVAPMFADLLDQLANGNVDTANWEKFGEVLGVIAAVILSVIAVVKTLTAIIKVITAVKKAWAVVQGILNAVMAASPITWIIMAIVALIAIIVLLVLNWDKVKAAVQAVWEKIVSIFSGIANWFKSKVIDPLVSFFAGLWDSIVSIFSSVASWFSNIFTSAWEGIKNAFSAVGSFFKGVWDSIVSIFTSIGTAVSDAISGAVKGAINKVLSGAIGIINGFITAINTVISVINAIPGVSINKLNKLEVPQLAEGGYVDANDPQAVIVGDNKNEGEIVSPISKMRDTVLEALSMFASSASVSSPTASVVSGGGGASKSVVQNVNINNTFNGDRAGQAKSAEAMNNASNDATSQMARALAFTG